MDKIPGASLKSLWRGMDMEIKERETRVVAQYVKQLQDQRSFDMIGNLYFHEDMLNGSVRTVPTTDDRFVVGSTVTAFMFAGGRKLRFPGNLGPYSDDVGYMIVLADVEVEDIKFLQFPEARTHDDFDEDAAGDCQKSWKHWESLENPGRRFFHHPLAPTHTHSH